jgi:hypothetical protein
MKNLIKIMVVLGISLSSIKSNSQNTFQKTYGANGKGLQVIKTNNGNYAMAGSFNNDVSLLILDKYGNKIVNKTYGGSALDDGNAIAQASDGSFFILGNTFSFITNGIAAAYLLKVDVTGNLIWSKSFQGDGSCMNTSSGWSILPTDDGGCIFSGGAGAFCTGEAGLFVTRINSSGNIIWSNVYDGMIGMSMVKTSDKMYACCSWKNCGATIEDVLLFKIDSNGVQQWAKTYGGSSTEYGYSLKETSDNGFIVVGSTESFGTSGRNVYVVRTNSLGDTLWTRSLESSGKRSQGNSVELVSDGFVIVGYNSDFTNSFYFNFLTKIDMNGNVLWSKNIISTNYDQYLHSLIVSGDDGYILVGQYGNIAYVAKTDSVGNVGCNESDANMNAYFTNTIVQNFVLPQFSVVPIVNNCLTIESASVLVIDTICSSITVGTQEFNKDVISVYPNPTQNYIIVQGVRKGNFQLFDSFGKLVFQKELTDKEEKIYLNDLPNGIYLYSIGNFTGKIVLIN